MQKIETQMFVLKTIAKRYIYTEWYKNQEIFEKKIIQKQWRLKGAIYNI